MFARALLVSILNGKNTSTHKLKKKPKKMNPARGNEERRQKSNERSKWSEVVELRKLFWTRLEKGFGCHAFVLFEAIEL